MTKPMVSPTVHTALLDTCMGGIVPAPEEVPKSERLHQNHFASKAGERGRKSVWGPVAFGVNFSFLLKNYRTCADDAPRQS
jgi:hypothetical protein